MKLITFTEASRTRIGLLQDQHVVDLSQAAPSLPQDMLRLLQAGDAAMQEAAKHTSAIAHFSMPDVVIEAPIKRPPQDSGHWAELPRPRRRKQYGYPQTPGRVYETSNLCQWPILTYPLAQRNEYARL